MSISEDEKLAQMVKDFIEEHESSNPSFLTTTFKPQCASFSATLQEILKEVTDAEMEISEKIECYFSRTDKKCMNGINNLKKWIVKRLLMDGSDASLCITSCSTTFSGGDYEYIDVIIKGKRLIVDIEFRSQFKVARPTQSYKELISKFIPKIFVGTEEKLLKVIPVLCSAAKQSLKESGLHIPPWRTTRFVQSKWLSKDCKRVSLPHYF